MHTIATTTAASRRGAAERSRGWVDRFLGLFADVRSGEGVTALLLMTNLFVLLAAYYLLKTIREPLILSIPNGAEIKSYSAGAISVLLMALVPAYGALASRVSRVKLINGVNLFFIACLVAFFVLSQAGVPIGVAFFVWVGIFSLMAIAQLWAFANDLYTVERGQRLFAIVGVGASLGAIAGAFATGQLVEKFGTYPFMIAAAVMLGLCVVLTTWIQRRENRRAEATPLPDGRDGRPDAGEESAPAQGDEPIRGRSGFALVFSDRYLLLIAGLMLLVNTVNTTGEYILGRTVVSIYEARQAASGAGALDEQKVIGEFYGNFFTVVNILSALVQAFLVSRVLKWFGVRFALLVLPVVALFGYAAIAFVPILPFIRGIKLAENSLDYSLQNTTRHALYLPTSREAKYKAKQANDAFFHRLGDVLSAALVFAGTTWLSFATRDFAIANVALTALWLALAVAIGLRYRRMTARMSEAPRA